MNRKTLKTGEFNFSTDGITVQADVLADIVVCVYDQEQAAGGMAVCAEGQVQQTLTGLFRTVKAQGCKRASLVVKVAGGGSDSGAPLPVEREIDAFCRGLDIRITSRSTGGSFRRTIRFETGTGEIMVKKSQLFSGSQPAVSAPAQAASTTSASAAPARKIRVLIVDDSSVIRNLFRKALGSEPDIEIFGLASDPMAAEQLMANDVPDVITLDMQMPVMDGLTYIERHLADRKIPTIVVTGASSADGDLAFKALDAGAVDFVEKPAAENMASFCRDLADKVRMASQINKAKLAGHQRTVIKARSTQQVDTSRVIVIGSSTGGTSALTNILTALDKDIPPILIVQHIPPVFSRLFAERLNSLVPFEVKEAEHNDAVLPGRVLIAPGGRQMKVKLMDRKLVVAVTDDPPVNKHAPSVDYLFDSAAEVLGPRAVAAILTGMGKDGARGMLKLHGTGCPTIAQDEKTSVVYGMPREAALIGAVDHVLPLQDIPERLLGLCSAKIRKISA